MSSSGKRTTTKTAKSGSVKQEPSSSTLSKRTRKANRNTLVETNKAILNVFKGMEEDEQIKREVVAFKKLDRKEKKERIRKVWFLLLQLLIAWGPSRSEFDHLLPYMGKAHRNWSSESRKRFYKATGPQSNFYCSPNGTCSREDPKLANMSFGDTMQFSRGLDIWKNPVTQIAANFSVNNEPRGKTMKNNRSKHRKQQQFNPPPAKQFKNSGRK